MHNKIIAFILVLAIGVSLCSCKTKSNTEIYDGDGNLITNATEMDKSNNLFAYVDIVLSEADEIIADKYSCTKREARQKILNNEYKVYTYCEIDTIAAMQKTCEEFARGFNFGCALTDLKGNLIAAYSFSESDNTNYAAKRTQQHSALKPLSVYAPAIEDGIINWSTQYEDSPYKKLEDENGIKRDWPSNATNKYYNEPVGIYKSIKESLNTVAVKCLNDYGVKKSISFLQQKFDMNLEYEEYQIKSKGEDEVIGNVALGYTQAGSSPVEMAGYYQIFGNGGYYKAPKAIEKIVDKDGKTIYQNTKATRKVITSETAYIMNQLLKGVVTPGGTGEKGHISGVDVVGKTGTGDENTDNWFVGVTPEFSCAVWHSNLGSSNIAAEMFSDFAKRLEIKNKNFATNVNVKKQIYCTESGKAFKPGCKKIEMGYYATNNLPEKCDLH